MENVKEPNLNFNFCFSTRMSKQDEPFPKKPLDNLKLNDNIELDYKPNSAIGDSKTLPNDYFKKLIRNISPLKAFNHSIKELDDRSSFSGLNSNDDSILHRQIKDIEFIKLKSKKGNHQEGLIDCALNHLSNDSYYQTTNASLFNNEAMKSPFSDSEAILDNYYNQLKILQDHQNDVIQKMKRNSEDNYKVNLIDAKSKDNKDSLNIKENQDQLENKSNIIQKEYENNMHYVIDTINTYYKRAFMHGKYGWLCLACKNFNFDGKFKLKLLKKEGADVIDVREFH